MEAVAPNNALQCDVAAFGGAAPELRRSGTTMRLTCLSLLFACFVAGCGQKSFVQKSSSMDPTIKADEVISAETGAYGTSSPRRRDVVVFSPPLYATPAASNTNELGIWVFRIVGLPGDVVSFDETGLLINGAAPSDRPSAIVGIQYKETAASRPRSPSLSLHRSRGSVFCSRRQCRRCE
jgi:signal peptidase I